MQNLFIFSMNANKLLILTGSLVTKLQAVYKKEEARQKKFLNRLAELDAKIDDFKKIKKLLN